jgi:hypothetical protein
MKLGLGILSGAFFFLSTLIAGQATDSEEAPKVTLSVPSGAPLRLYLTKKISKRAGEPVEGKILEPVYAFDKQVVPAGSVVTGKVSQVQPVTKMLRFRAVVNGDFTPLRDARVEFDTLTLPDGSKRELHTVAVMGLNSIYTEPSNKKTNKKQKAQRPQDQNGGILGTAKQQARDQINGQINARTRGIADIVRGPNKKEKLVDFMWTKLPYHPQYVRRGTRFDAPLRDPLEFGTESVKVVDLSELGSQPGADSIVHARLLTALDSGTAKKGETVEAVVAAPLFSASQKLVLPEGTRLIGTVTAAKKARSFHRPGVLRFSFQKVELPEEVANLRPAAPAPAPLKTQATLEAAEGSGPAPIKVDSEGGVQAQESKTRFIAPLISLVLASRAADNDEGHHAAAGTGNAGAQGNIAGRTLGGGLGFGLLGSAMSQSSKYVGMGFGYYGLAWSVYSAVIAVGGEVEFNKNAVMDIRFGARTPPPTTSKFREIIKSTASVRAAPGGPNLPAK